MRHPLESIPGRTRHRVFALFLVATLLVMAVLNILDVELRTPAAPWGIVSYELAGTVSAAEAMIASWGETARVRAGFELGLDYLFIILYSATIAAACVWAAGMWGEHAKALGRLGVVLAWSQLAAALMDAIENAALLGMLLGRPASPWPQLAAFCATAKFGLVLLGLAYSTAGVILWVIRKLTGKRPAATPSP